MGAKNLCFRIIARDKRLKKLFSNILPEAISVPFSDGFSICIDPRDIRGPSFHLARELWRPEIALDGYEPRERKFIHQAIAKRNGRAVFFDIGANIGLYSLPVALEFPETKIFAFEPHPVNALCLKNSILENRIDNLSLQEFGLSDKEGVATLYLDESDSGGHSLISSNMWNNKRTTKEIEIKLHCLDEWFVEKKISALDVLKIDVQGAEPAVFDGGMRVLQKYQPDILIEIQFSSLLERGEVLSHLKSICQDYYFRNMEDDVWRPLNKLSEDVKRRSDEGYLISDYFFSKSGG
jgi:FkbM family methyltransferase